MRRRHTLGCFVRCADGSVAVLSNNHVLAGVNRGTVPSDRILSPMGLSDHTTTDITARHIANLHSFEPLQFPENPRQATGEFGIPSVVNQIDAALASVCDEVAAGARYQQQFPIINGRRLPAPTRTRSITEDVFNLRVFKVGRTTGYTEGTITVPITETTVQYSRNESGYFEDVFIVDPTDEYPAFSRRGDSGSVVMDFDGNVLGLLFAGSTTYDGRGFAYVCPIETVFSRLNCTLLT